MSNEHEIDSKRFKELAGILNECSCQDNEVLEEDTLETTAGAVGLLTSGVATALVVLYGGKLVDLFKGVVDDIEDKVSDFKDNVIKASPEDQKKIMANTRKIVERFLHDENMISLFEKLRMYQDGDDAYSMNNKNNIIKSMERYIDSKLSADEKKYLKDVMFKITGSF